MITKFLDALGYIVSHPLTRASKASALARFLRWQLGSRLLSLPCLFQFAGGTHLFAVTGLHSATGNYYVGLLPFEEMAFMLHFLREGELFVDVGANIGAFSVLASGVCRARSHAFEPARASCEWLEMNRRINGLEPLMILSRCAVGSADGGTEKFVESAHSAVNHVLRPGEIAACVETPLVSLDTALRAERPVLIKIDVEGFETSVIDGASRLLSQDSLKALILELRGHGARYGFDESALFDRILALGFAPCTYDPLTRILTELEPAYGARDSQQEIFCRDIDYVRQRLASAPSVRILDQDI